MTTTAHDAGPRSAEASRRSVQDVQRRARIHELENEVERYRQASEDALQQLDWCIGYMCGSGKRAVARSLSKNRAYIRTHLLKRAEQPLPTEQPGPTQETEAS
jgi:protein-tyrosine-phosphatase